MKAAAFSLVIASIISSIRSQWCASKNLQSLDKDFSITVPLKETPPTTNTLKISINPCNKLRPELNGDHCPDPSRICLIYSNIKGSDTRVVKVIPTGDGEPTISTNANGFTAVYAGSVYVGVQQSTKVDFTCGTESNASPTFEKYDESTLHLKWAVKEVCSQSTPPATELPKTDTPASTPSPPASAGWSVFTWIFLIFVLYMLGSSIYNYSVKQERFPECIPHLGLWMAIWHGATGAIGWVMGKIKGGGGNYVQL